MRDFGPAAEVLLGASRRAQLSFDASRGAHPLCRAKGPQAIDAPPGLIRLDGGKAREGGPIGGVYPKFCGRAYTRPARDKSVRP